MTPRERALLLAAGIVISTSKDAATDTGSVLYDISRRMGDHDAAKAVGDIGAGLDAISLLLERALYCVKEIS
jgi:hypothetical protein